MNRNRQDKQQFKQKSKKAFGRKSVGVVKRHPDGFGFFIPDDPDLPDVYVNRKSMSGVMSNDRVEVEVFPEPGSDRFRGEIISVVKRNATRAMGQFHADIKSGRGVLHDKVGAWGTDLLVDTNSFTVNDGDWVAVQITSYPDEPTGFRGKIVAIIGDAEDPQNDALRVLHQNSIPFEFSSGTLKEVEKLAETVTEKDWAGRKDLRQHKLITIDGKTAKDFDDAILVEKRPQGFRLWVAIADVSHYVKPGTNLDDDAYERGTSTYFPSFVAPMLPEKLSNNLCSLNPNVPRLSLVAEIDFDYSGEMQRTDFYEAVIQSHARVTYGEAQEVIEGRCPPQFEHVKEQILLAEDLAKILMAKRFKEGSLSLELPETIIELDDLGQPIDIMQAERLFAHKLIEEMMLSANVAVAKFIGSKAVPSLYRIHEPPDPDAIDNFNHFLMAFGYNKSVSGSQIAKKLTEALQEFAGHPKEHILNMLALRSMSQAKYSPNNVGHFGLGFADYSHFTSPIRRYPDLIIHRILKALLYPKAGYKLYSEEEMGTAGSFLSSCEQRSVKAERQINAIKKARFMSKYVGEEFEGVVSSVTKFGMFVILRQFDIDGLIRLDALPGGPFEYDEDTMRLVARKSGYSFSIGDNVRIQVGAADTDNGQIDFVLLEDEKLMKHLEENRQDFRDMPRKNKGNERGKGRDKDRGKDRGKERGKSASKDSRESQSERAKKRGSRRPDKNKGKPKRGAKQETRGGRRDEYREEAPRSQPARRPEVRTPAVEPRIFKRRDDETSEASKQERTVPKKPMKLSDMIRASSSQGLRFGKPLKKKSSKRK